MTHRAGSASSERNIRDLPRFRTPRRALCPGRGARAPGHHPAHPHPGRDAAGLPVRARRPGSWPHRLGQDLRLPAAPGGAPDRRAAPSRGASAPLSHPRPHARARLAARRLAQAARGGRGTAQRRRLRRGGPEPAGEGSRRRYRRARRVPRPTPGPHGPGACRPRRHRGHRHRRGRPHGRHGLPADGPQDPRQDAAQGSADAVLRDPRLGREQARQAVPARARHPLGGPGFEPRRHHGAPRARGGARGTLRRAARSRRRPRTHHHVHAHQVRREEPRPQAQRSRGGRRRSARQPLAERAHPEPRGLRHRRGHHDGLHRHRRPRHPRGRSGPRGPCRSARRAQGVPAPLRSHRPRGRVRHRDHGPDPGAEARRERSDAQGRHQAHRPPAGEPRLHRAHAARPR